MEFRYYIGIGQTSIIVEQDNRIHHNQCNIHNLIERRELSEKEIEEVSENPYSRPIEVYNYESIEALIYNDAFCGVETSVVVINAAILRFITNLETLTTMKMDIDFCLSSIDIVYRSFTHRGKRLSKKQVKKVLDYSSIKGYKCTSELSVKEIDKCSKINTND